MKKFIFTFLISCFSLAIISCSDDKEEYTENSVNSTTTTDNTNTTDNTTTTDTTVPVIAEVTVVTTPTNDTTPDYTFSSSEAGTITYGGSCSSSDTSAATDNNTITLDSLSAGTYSDCTITVTDSTGNASSALSVNSFVVDTTAPTVSSTSPSDSASSVSIGTTISVTFSESMDTSLITTNSSNTTCTGTIQLSSDSFSSCIQMSSTPIASNSNKTFSSTPSSNLSSETSYKIRVTTLVKDVAGNSMSNSYTTSNGFTSADETAPILSQVTVVTTPTNDNTSLSYTFHSDEAGAITYGGSCSSSTNSATASNNTITFNALEDETYSDCTITVTDSTGNASSALSVNSFVVDTTSPSLSQTTAVTSPTNNSTPSYVFSSSEAGTISYGGSCSSSTTSASAGDNNISFNTLSDAEYSDCTIIVIDSAGNSSSSLSVDSFRVKTTWTLQFDNGSNSTSGGAIDFDSSGNIYIGGSINSKLFNLKYSSSGTVISTKQIDSSQGSGDVFGDMLVHNDKIIIAGKTTGLITGNTYSSPDFFMIKHDDSFDREWAIQDIVGRITTNGIYNDSSGNIYIVGTNSAGGVDNWQNAHDQSPGTKVPRLKGDTGQDSDDIILGKYNSNGVVQWKKEIGTEFVDTGYGITIDSSNDIIITGYTQENLDNETNTTACEWSVYQGTTFADCQAGSAAIFIMKLSSSGTVLWTKLHQSSGSDIGYAVTTDSSDNIYVTGMTTGGLDNNTQVGSGDMFLVKYNSSGTKQWTKQPGTSSRESGQSVITDTSGNIYVTGYTGGSLDGNTNQGSNDIFLVKYNSSGVKQWTKQLGTSSSDYGSAIGIFSSNNQDYIYITGTTDGALDGNTNSEASDIFVVKYNTDGVKQ